MTPLELMILVTFVTFFVVGLYLGGRLGVKIRRRLDRVFSNSSRRRGANR